MEKEKLIPNGIYCYNGNVYCPYSTSKNFNDVRVPWCDYLDKGGVDNGHTEEEWNKLIEYFGTENNIFDFLPLDLLWDSCKECGINK
jgi:hypothetical protein